MSFLHHFRVVVGGVMVMILVVVLCMFTSSVGMFVVDNFACSVWHVFSDSERLSVFAAG